MTEFIEADHWSRVPKADWKWKDFTPHEMACRGTGRIKISVELMDKLQLMRTRLKCPFIVNSGYRSPEHNAAVGGAKDSLHMRGMATDVSMANHDPEVFTAEAVAVGMGGIGWYPPKKGNFIHVDVGPEGRRWGKLWRAEKHAADTEPRPKTAKKATGVVGLSTLATAAAGAASPESLKEIQETITPWLQYAPQFQALFMATGAGIIGWMLWNRFFKKAP